MRGLFTAGVLDVLALYKALVTRHVWYNEALEYIDSRVAAGAAVLIAPKETLEISRVCHDPDAMQRAYDIGRRKAEAIVNDRHLHKPCAVEKIRLHRSAGIW